MASIAAPQRKFSDKQRKKLAGSGAAMPDGSFPIKSEQDLKNAIHAIGRAKDPAAAKKHIISRAHTLGLTKLLPADWTGSAKNAADAPEKPEMSAHSVLIPDGEAPPEWIELLPAGRFQGNDGRGPYTLEDAEGVIAASNAARGLPIDFNHATDYGSPLGLPAPAAGWIRELAVRGGAIHGRVEWTEKGAAAISAKEYRFISPVFTHTKEGLVLAIQRAGLTNNPNLNLTAVASAATAIGAAAMADENGGGGEMSLSKVIAGLEKVFPNLPPQRILEIAQGAMNEDGDLDDGTDAQDAADGDGDGFDATESADAMRARHESEMAQCAEEDKPAMEAKHAKQRALYEANHRAAPAAQAQLDETQMAAMVAKHPLMLKTQKQLSDLLAERAQEKALLAVNAAVKDGKIIPGQREWALKYAFTDPAGFAAFVAKQPVMLAREDGTFVGAPAGGPSQNDQLSEIELTICSETGVSEEDFKKQKAANTSLTGGVVRRKLNITSPTKQPAAA